MLDFAEVTKQQFEHIEDDLMDFGVVGPGPRRTLNWLCNRRWFDNEYDRTPAAEEMYVDERRRNKKSHRSKTIGGPERGRGWCADRRCVASVLTSCPTQTLRSSRP